MRHLRRLTTTKSHPRGKFLLAVASVFIIAACSLPDINIRKEKRYANAFTTGESASAPDKKYLATVHVRFSDNKAVAPLSFDIRKDKRSMIAAKLWQSEETITTMHLGYTRNDGPIVGFKFRWGF